MGDSARAWRELCALLAVGAADLLTAERASVLRFRVDGGADGGGTGGMRSSGRFPGKPRAPRFSVYADWAYLAAVTKRQGREMGSRARSGDETGPAPGGRPGAWQRG